MAVLPPGSIPEVSSLQKTLDNIHAKSPTEALPLEILHNLRYQHKWTDLKTLKPQPPARDVPSLDLTERSPSRTRPSAPTLLTGVPAKPIYIHPTYQAHLLKQKIPLETLDPQTEYVFPLTLGQSFTLRLLQAAFESIPEREVIEGENGFRHQDSKRILMAMRGRQGIGGDGTVNYYIVQEGEVKPRQN
jgi:tRNA-splicing endonuclease subunit Sen15, fungi type